MEVSGAQMILGLVIAIMVLIFLVIKTKVHVFLALIIAASITGLVGGMAPPDVVSAITEGFGSTLGSVAIIIGFGVMMGRILEVSGAAERLAYTVVKVLGKRKEEWAMAVTGYIVSIPIFVDSAFIILSTLAKALSKKTGKSIVTLAIALAGGAVVMHHAVPPTPGPLGVAGIFGVDVGLMILSGLIFGIPIIIVTVLYAKWIGKKIYQLPDDDGLGWIRPEQEVNVEDWLEEKENKELPSLLRSAAPIVVPILLIFMNTTVTAIGLEGTLVEYVQFFGSPVIAVGIAVLLAIYGLFNHVKRSEALDRMEEGIQTAGIILLVTGAGGALGYVLRQTGAGDYIAELVVDTGIPAILLPFVIASLVRLIQGSGTVAMITAASISAPILTGMDVNLVLAAQAAALGAMVFSYFNDSLFWVVNRTIGIKDPKEQMLVWSVPTTLSWLTALVCLLIANLIFG
ncbi:GntP family permease [Halalkalibacterium halodurans]|uniref:Gluconate permease n=2 Tax=Halalkalibacterium halodurans TaxID=86665 RepID=Q7AJX1_HALH5|nr:GntP family permease [Halalkalibacterium halodurans]MED4081423.1 GntP family permease [Halalkalibacterium halodurans]MED4083295.1 GntP family permease [Halalkalibacterium halodurans]MED4106514.1 GntP family permease [Halalkalibacterium halodurans]MED4108749.1 GntP family permease [Halalkalibacterium halodurans]MED4122690.1 GntP family permease [Halalkalibacterium halodurans]